MQIISESVKIKVKHDYILIDVKDHSKIKNGYLAINNHGTATIGFYHDGKTDWKVLSRHLLDITDPKVFVDHINHNKLDNRRENLRLCDNQQNTWNRLPLNQNKYKGVTYCKTTGKWKAQITKTYKNKHLGRFETEYEAAIAYDKAAQKYFGEFAHLNFPNK